MYVPQKCDTDLLLIPSANHNVPVFAWEDLVWNDRRVRGTMPPSLCTSDLLRMPQGVCNIARWSQSPVHGRSRQALCSDHRNNNIRHFSPQDGDKQRTHATTGIGIL